MDKYVKLQNVLETLRKANIGGYITDRLLEIPLADVQPVRRGKWQGANEMPYDDIMVCSECEHEAYWDTDYGQQLFDYCPHCGARMDAEPDEPWQSD